ARDFGGEELAGEWANVRRARDSLVFEDPEGVRHELRVVETSDEPLVAKSREIAVARACQGFGGVRAYAIDHERSTALLEYTLGFQRHGGNTWEGRGDR